MFTRRHLALLLTILALTTLGTASARSLTASSKLSTEEAIQLLTRPASKETVVAAAAGLSAGVDYHGIAPFRSFDGQNDGHQRAPGVNRLEQKQAVDDDVESQQGRQGRSRVRLNVDQYPPKDIIPDVNHPQVQAWIKEIDWSKVPKIPVAQGTPDMPRFPKCPPEGQVNPDHCWWSCGGCLQPDDVVSCPSQDHWGLTYDDGPSLASRELIKNLKEKDLSATFFIVGSQVLDYPDILKEQVEAGHHIAMHSKSQFFFSSLRRLIS